MELVVEHQRPHPQAGCGFGRDHQRDEGIDCADVVVRKQFVVAEQLDQAGQRDQCVVVTEIASLDREPKWSDHGATIRPHKVQSPAPDQNEQGLQLLFTGTRAALCGVARER